MDTGTTVTASVIDGQTPTIVVTAANAPHRQAAVRALVRGLRLEPLTDAGALTHAKFALEETQAHPRSWMSTSVRAERYVFTSTWTGTECSIGLRLEEATLVITVKRSGNPASALQELIRDLQWAPAVTTRNVNDALRRGRPVVTGNRRIEVEEAGLT